MTAPTPNGRSGGTNTTASTSQPITLPAGVVAGELLIVEICFYSGATTGMSVSATSGWSIAYSSLPSSNIGLAVLTKTATGSDALTVTTGSSCKSSHNSYRYPTGCTVAGISTATTGSGLTPAPDAGSVTPAAGSNDYAYHAFAGVQGTSSTQSTFSAAPSGYSNMTTR